jgi:hypothetical protein
MQKGHIIKTDRKLGPGVLGAWMETHFLSHLISYLYYVLSLLISFLYAASFLSLYSLRLYSFTIL